MKHVILAAGEGTTSFERSEQIPKCLVEVNNLKMFICMIIAACKPGNCCIEYKGKNNTNLMK